MIKLNLHIVKLTSVVISLIYVLMPLHNEFKSIFHSISHHLNLPDVELSHGQHEHLHSETSSHSFHSHKIIDLLDYLADDSSNNEDSNKAKLVDNKIDKHFYPIKHNIIKVVVKKSTKESHNYTEKIHKGFFRKILDPPIDARLQHS